MMISPQFYLPIFSTPSLRRFRVQPSLALLLTLFPATSLMLPAGPALGEEAHDSVFSMKADCTLVGPFAGSYQRGWTLKYEPDNTAWLAHGSSSPAQLQLMARGYRVGTGEYQGAAWYATFQQQAAVRQISITAYPANGSKPYLVDLVTQTQAQTISCPNAVTNEKVQAALPQLDRLINNAIDEGRIPGLAVGIVYKGQVVYLKGFGVREVGQPDLVDPDTVFQLASVSKALSSTVVSSLVSDGTVKWDDPVIKFDPQFELSDPTVTSQVTIGDMFAHRSGLPGSAGNDLEAIGFKQRTILYRLRFLPLVYPFRNGYQYSNFGLTEGGVAAAKAAGEDWATVADRQLFEPLGMTQTSMRYADFIARADRAHLHVLVNKQWTPLLTRDADAQAPAGGASSSARDLLNFLILELANGQYGGKQLIRREPLDVARTPQSIRGPDPATGLNYFYGFGWALQYLQDGVLSVDHSGAFSDGAGTNITLLPSQDLGVVALGNAFPTGVPEAVASSLSDLTRYGYVTQDWFVFWKNLFDQSNAIQEAIKKYANPPVPNHPPLELAAYVGTYRNNYLGKVTITLENGVLSLNRGVQQAPLPLRHWDGNTFLSFPDPLTPELPALVDFTQGADGKVSQIFLEEFAANGEQAATVTRPGEQE